MMLFFMKPYSLLLSLIMIMGTLMSLSANNWFFIWVGMELTLYAFIPFILQFPKNLEKEAAIKYFIIQSIASGLFLTTVMAAPNLQFLMSILFITLILKLGMAPCHFWLPSVMNSLSWHMCWLLATFMKITPMTLIIFIMNSTSSFIIYTCIISSALISGIGGLNQTQIRAIIAYSSIGHMAWMLSASMTSPNVALLYFISYLMITSSVFFNLTNMPISQSPSMSNSLNMNSTTRTTFILSMLSLGGLPPLFGFFPKLMVMFSLAASHNFFIVYFLIISSSLNLYYYLKIISSLFFNTRNQMISLFMNSWKSNILFSIFMSLATLSAIFFMPILIL